MSRRGRHNPPYLRPRVCKLVANWPPADRAAWAKATEVGDSLDPGGWASHWAPLSRHKAQSDYGRWLSWLEAEGELDSAVAPSVRATKERVGRYLTHLQSHLRTFTVQSALQGLGDMLRVMTQTQTFGWVAKGASRLRSQATSTRNKRQRLKSPDQLVELGMRLMAEAEILHETDASAAALQSRNGLIIAFLAYSPLRAANLAAITQGRHLVKRGDAWWLFFAAEETKERRPIEFPFPAGLVTALERYLALYRPILTAKGAHRGSAGRAIWISQDGGALTSDGIAMAVSRLTKAEFGAHINQHMFRDCAATMIAIDDPGHVHIIPAILGHSTLTTSERHYNQASGLDAGRQYHVILGTKRRASKRSRKDSSRAAGAE